MFAKALSVLQEMEHRDALQVHGVACSVTSCCLGPLTSSCRF